MAGGARAGASPASRKVNHSAHRTRGLAFTLSPRRGDWRGGGLRAGKRGMCLGRRSLRRLRKALTLPLQPAALLPPSDPGHPRILPTLAPGAPWVSPTPPFLFLLCFLVVSLARRLAPPLRIPNPTHPCPRWAPPSGFPPASCLVSVLFLRMQPRFSSAQRPPPSRVDFVFLCLALFRFVGKWEGTHFFLL